MFHGKAVKFSGIENNYPHTHGDIIFLPPDFFDPSTDESSTFYMKRCMFYKDYILKSFQIYLKNGGSILFLNNNIIITHVLIQTQTIHFGLGKIMMILVALYKKSKIYQMLIIRQLKIAKEYDINQDYYNYFGLYHNHYHVNEISAELLAQYIMNRNKKTNATIILDNWYINNLKHK